MDLTSYKPSPPNYQSYLGGNPSTGSSSGQSNNKISFSGFGAGLDMATGVLGALDSIFGWSTKRQHRYQKELMNKQQDQWKEQQTILAQQQFEQWTRENEYNDPTNYYKRLLAGADANGISKAGALGDMPGGSVGQSATGVSAPGAVSLPGVGGSSLLPFGSTSILGNMRQRAETNLIDAQADYYEHLAGKTSEETVLTRLSQETQQALTQLHHSSSYSQRMAGYLAKTNAENIETLQPFEIDTLISRSAKDFEDSLLSRGERNWLGPRYTMDMINALSLIIFRGAATEAERELARSRNFDNQLWQTTLDHRAKIIESEATVAGYEAETFKGSMWWNRVNQTLGNVLSLGSTVAGMNTAKAAMTMKNATKNVLIKDYKVYLNGRQQLTSGRTITTSYGTP